MNKYEILYILDKDTTDETKEAVQAKLESVVTERGGSVVEVDKWGDKRFAYPINFKNDGYYVLMNAIGTPEVPAEIERQIRIIPEAVRVMVVKK